MVDIVIGSSQAPAWRQTAAPPAGSLQVEAKLLAVRPPRQKREPVGPVDQQRRNVQHATDPTGGQVLILLVPDKRALPRNLEDGRFKVVLHFVPKHKD